MGLGIRQQGQRQCVLPGVLRFAVQALFPKALVGIAEGLAIRRHIAENNRAYMLCRGIAAPVEFLHAAQCVLPRTNKLGVQRDYLVLLAWNYERALLAELHELPAVADVMLGEIGIEAA